MFSGSIPALVTPFRDGAFDEPAFRKLVDWQIENGSSAKANCRTFSITDRSWFTRSTATTGRRTSR